MLDDEEAGTRLETADLRGLVGTELRRLAGRGLWRQSIADDAGVFLLAYSICLYQFMIIFAYISLAYKELFWMRKPLCQLCAAE